MGRVFTVSCIGFGARGYIYTSLMNKQNNHYKIVSICEKNPERLYPAQKLFNLPDEACFLDDKEFFREKRSDILIVSTQDQDHVKQSLIGLKLGYDILVEKPISNKEEEIRELLKAQEETGHKVFVCHVLRYAPAFKKVKELLNSGVIGELVLIDSVENVGYSHQAHSYVRGNWRDERTTSPMILAKCCHDLDLLTWYTGSEYESVSSIGDLRYFKKENQPKGASDRCYNCKYQDTCPYSAITIYLKQNFWGREMVTNKRPITNEELLERLKDGPYGRCVFASDNNVVDNEITMIHFKNGVNACLRMIGFTAHGGRVMKFYGTQGQIDLDEENGFIAIKPFGKEDEILKISSLVDAISGHGGGDEGLIDSLYDLFNGKTSSDATSLRVSIESHLLAFDAEKSRLHHGELIKRKD